MRGDRTPVNLEQLYGSLTGLIKARDDFCSRGSSFSTATWKAPVTRHGILGRRTGVNAVTIFGDLASTVGGSSLQGQVVVEMLGPLKAYHDPDHGPASLPRPYIPRTLSLYPDNQSIVAEDGRVLGQLSTPRDGIIIPTVQSGRPEYLGRVASATASMALFMLDRETSIRPAIVREAAVI